ncbi:MAG: hypothetical protein JJ900_08760 [Rhodospirillales bacterium]|nr:hypothetical protein [Rhodospirillales bacterium]MBO6786929.1 hypothetical protein [Rhodospirillales bacterium]
MIVAVLAMCSTAGAVERGFVDKFCIEPPHGRLCAVLPFDQADFSSDFNYMLIEKGAQDPFDVFSWQAFVALNWPADQTGRPVDGRLGVAPKAPRVWQSFIRRPALFGPDTVLSECGGDAQAGTLLVGDLVQSDGSVLIDRHGNFAVYTTYANTVVADYIRDNGLTDAEGQTAFTKTEDIAFPRGRLSDEKAGTTAAAPSITLKMAWRVMSGDGAAGQSYLTRPAVIHVPEERSRSGKPMCLNVTLGLVGMHVAMRTESGNGSEWIWATFEHVDNAPVAANARNVNSIYDDELFPGGCQAPVRASETQYAFFDPNCPDCRTNTMTAIDWRWASAPPFARDVSGEPVEHSQVVRCWDIFESTAAVNRLWQEKLKGSVFANYMLISTQWRGTDPHPLFEHGEVPRYLTNITLETYQQTAKVGTCLGCHATAETASGAPADFVFMLQRADQERTRP